LWRDQEGDDVGDLAGLGGAAQCCGGAEAVEALAGGAELTARTMAAAIVDAAIPDPA
jgi:hypothetical protein